MNIKTLAQRIPNDVRSLLIITVEDPIENAVPNAHNSKMKILIKIWNEFVEPEKEWTDCPICINNILTNYRQMKETLVNLENEYQLLKRL